MQHFGNSTKFCASVFSTPGCFRVHRIVCKHSLSTFLQNKTIEAGESIEKAVHCPSPNKSTWSVLQISVILIRLIVSLPPPPSGRFRLELRGGGVGDSFQSPDFGLWPENPKIGAPAARKNWKMSSFVSDFPFRNRILKGSNPQNFRLRRLRCKNTS